MASSVSITKKVPVAAPQPMDSLAGLLKTNNIFLFVPNIIGEKKRLFKISNE
jgi:hypothetical protein